MTNEKNDINYIPVVLSYPDDGYAADEFPELVKAIESFRKEIKIQYPGQNVRCFLLPEGLVEAFMNTQDK